MTIFTIEPHVGPLPLRFGMRPAEVEQILGRARNVRQNFDGNRVEFRETLNLGYVTPDDVLREVIFTPESNLVFHGSNLFQLADPISFLRQFDPEPKLWVGFVIFLKLGVSISGLHDHDESQKAIAVKADGYWDEYLEDFKPLD